MEEPIYGGLIDKYYLRDMFLIIFSILIIIFLTFYIFSLFAESTNQAVQFCNNKCGVDEWVFEEKDRNTFSEKIYIGQIWECKCKVPT